MAKETARGTAEARSPVGGTVRGLCFDKEKRASVASLGGFGRVWPSRRALRRETNSKRVRMESNAAQRRTFPLLGFLPNRISRKPFGPSFLGEPMPGTPVKLSGTAPATTCAGERDGELRKKINAHLPRATLDPYPPCEKRLMVPVGFAARTLPRRIPRALTTPVCSPNVPDTEPARPRTAAVREGTTADLHTTTGVHVFFVADARAETAFPASDAPMCAQRAAMVQPFRREG